MHATGMELAEKSAHESWALQAEVQIHLATMPEHPHDDHSTAVQQLVPRGLRGAHAVSLHHLVRSMAKKALGRLGAQCDSERVAGSALRASGT